LYSVTGLIVTQSLIWKKFGANVAERRRANERCKMKKSTWMIRGTVGLLAWIGIGLAVAEAAVILPVDPVTRVPIAGSTVTVSILKGAVDVTATWLPEPGETVQIVVNGVAIPSISIVFNAATAGNPIANPGLTTSAYPGQCTNFNNPVLAANAADFQLSGNNLTSTDCGGMAVIQVTAASLATPLTFILPQDSNFNGIPDIWESTFCPANACLTGREDADASPGNANIGDGIAAFDEYRGFIVSGAHVRTDPRQKDLFVHVVNPQCLAAGTDPLASTASYLGGGPTTFVTGDAFFGNINTLSSGTQVRRLGYRANLTNYTTNEWVDNLSSYAALTGLKFVTGTDGAVSDRRINVNQVAGTAVQKGLRIIECVVNDTGTTLGVATLGSPNGGDNSIIFTQRIVNYFGKLGATQASANLCYQTFQNGAWTAAVALTYTQLIGKAIAFYTSMEVGHSEGLTPAQEGTSQTKTLYGYHHAPGTGSNLDQTIINKPTAACGNLFQIPTNYNTSDQTNFKFK
jgi:hypothetical protein